MKKTKCLKTWVGLFRVTIFWVGTGSSSLGGNFLGRNFLGVIFPGDNFPDTICNNYLGYCPWLTLYHLVGENKLRDLHKLDFTNFKNSFWKKKRLPSGSQWKRLFMNIIILFRVQKRQFLYPQIKTVRIRWFMKFFTLVCGRGNLINYLL